MKEKLTRNIGVKILSVVLATLLWLVITNLNDPVRYETFTIPVTILNESLVKTKTQSYEVLEGEEVQFKIAARRSIVESLSDADFSATADFASLSKVNSVDIMITPRRHKDEIEIVDRGDVRTVNISIEELSEKEIKINVLTKGKAGEGYFVVPKSASPGFVRIEGPKSRIDKIKQVVVEANVEGATTRLNRVLRPIALDEEGNEIDASRLSFSHPNITLEIDLFPIKEISLDITTTGQPADGYIMTNIEHHPKTIEIAADSTKLAGINVLEVPYDITGADADIEEFIELAEWLDSGVHLVGTDTTASVNITIEKLETKELSIWPNDIEIRNKPDNLQVEYITKGPIYATILGPIGEIEDIARNTLKPYISLIGYSSGTYSFRIETDISEHILLEDTQVVWLSLKDAP